MKLSKSIYQSLALGICLGLVVSHAQPAMAADVRIARAKKHFQAGQSHYATGSYADALDAFEAAYSYKPLSGFLFNMGQCHMELKGYTMALRLYNQYLREAPKARNRAKVEERIREAMAALHSTQPVAPAKVLKKEKKPVVNSAVPASSVMVSQAVPPEVEPALVPLVTPQPTPDLLALSPVDGQAMKLAELDDPAIYESWWFWTVATSLVAASVSAVIVSQTAPTDQWVAPSGPLGTIDRR